MHWPAPEFRQQLALNLDVLDVLGVLRRLNGGNRLVEHQVLDRPVLRIEVDLFRRAEEIRPAPYSIAAPRLDPSAVLRCGRFSDETFRTCATALHPILAGRNVCEALDRITQHGPIDDSRLARLQPVDVDAKTSCVTRIPRDFETAAPGCCPSRASPAGDRRAEQRFWLPGNSH